MFIAVQIIHTDYQTDLGSRIFHIFLYFDILCDTGVECELPYNNPARDTESYTGPGTKCVRCSSQLGENVWWRTTSTRYDHSSAWNLAQKCHHGCWGKMWLIMIYSGTIERTSGEFLCISLNFIFMYLFLPKILILLIVIFKILWVNVFMYMYLNVSLIEWQSRDDDYC